jgi:tetratricopeptide (TPR) repeat protein
MNSNQINQNKSMKSTLFIAFIVFIFSWTRLEAQEIYGDWIKTNVTYLNNTELPDNNDLKYHFLRYSFEKPNRFFMSIKFDDKGTALSFERNSNLLHIKNPYGFVINSFQVEKMSTNELVLVQKGENGFNEEYCLKYHFVNEQVYQNQLPLTSSDVLYVNGNDTVYRASEKIHPKFLGNKSFFDFCFEKIPESSTVMATNNLFVATFVVTKEGALGDIQILENINKRFEKQFLNALNKSKSLWIPAEINGEKVDVQMSIEFKFISSNKFLPMYDFSKKGKTALDNNDFLKALRYFELALEITPDDTEIIYQKAICEMNLGNIGAACESLEKVKASRKMNVDELIMKNCKNK